MKTETGDYYPLEEAVQKLEISFNELVRMAICGEIKFSYYFRNQPTTTGDYTGWAHLHPDQASRLESWIIVPGTKARWISISKFVSSEECERELSPLGCPPKRKILFAGYSMTTGYPQQKKPRFYELQPKLEPVVVNLLPKNLYILGSELRRLSPGKQDSGHGIVKNIQDHHETLPSSHVQSVEDKGKKVKSWKRIALYLSCPISTAKTKLEGRRWKNVAVLQGGNVPGGVWAWSKALDYINENPVSTARKKQIAEEKKYFKIIS